MRDKLINARRGETVLMVDGMFIGTLLTVHAVMHDKGVLVEEVSTGKRGVARGSDEVERFDYMFTPIRAGRCMVPPHGLTFFEYNPEKHGPLVHCRYETASYGGGEGACALCGKIGCRHPELLGRTYTFDEWQRLPEILPNGTPRSMIFHEEARHDDLRRRDHEAEGA
jgi:hypothetical protein